MTLSQRRRIYYLITILVVMSTIGSVLTPTFAISSTVVKAQASQQSSFLPFAVQEGSSVLGTVEEDAWATVGANSERTSWTPEEVRGLLNPVWFKPFEPYISQKVQIIAAYGLLYISTASGLYAIDASTGAERWVYPTELPLGHSPTVADDVVYVGGLDHKLYALDAHTGAFKWAFSAEAGFQTNPLVINGVVYAGNRDGVFYAIHATGPNAGTLAWQYRVGSPILYSAAYKDGVLFFAAQDSYAYALNSGTGSLVWKSDKLPGAGFYSWWPVVYRDRVIFAGGSNYRFLGLGPGSLINIERADIFPNYATEPRGTLVGPLGATPGDWESGTVTIDAKRIQDYLVAKPWRRTYFVLDRSTGQQREIAPVAWTGTQSAGNRYPPVVGGDDVLYQQNAYMSDPHILGGQISGWQIGTANISVISSDWGAVDEPHAYSAGGNLIYWNLCCDRQAGAIDITMPNTRFAERWNANILPPSEAMDRNREWLYFNYNLPTLIPNYRQFHNPDTNYASSYASYGINGVYGDHGNQNPPIPYQGKVYLHRGNGIIALDASGSALTTLPLARIPTPPTNTVDRHTRGELQEILNQEIGKIVDAGHLRPGYHSHGIFDLNARNVCGDDLVDYWHQPAETLYTLLQALPHLSTDLQSRVRTYLQDEMRNYPPYRYNHIGWRDGAAREAFDLPPEVESARLTSGPQQENFLSTWRRNPYLFYVLWKYAQTFENAQSLYTSSQAALRAEYNRRPSDDVLLRNPHMHNAYIAGYLGYLELEEMAGSPESADVRQELDRLMQLRANNFTQASAYSGYGMFNPTQAYCRTLNVANNFMYLVPELADYLRTNALVKVQAAVTEYLRYAPYWFVAFSDEGFAENYTNPLYDGHALFTAKALILEESGQSLDKYLDVPAFVRGDLFYIQKLVTLLVDYPEGDPEPNQNPSAQNDSATTPQGTAVVINALGNDSDSDGGMLTITGIGTPSHGIVSIESNQIRYTPAGEYSGVDSFTYTIADGQGGIATATITVTVNGTTQPPPVTTGPRINVPYFAGDIAPEQSAVAWLGQVNETSNYADIRVGYTSTSLRVYVNVFDRRLWYDTTPSEADLTTWDAVTLYLNLAGSAGESLTNNSHRFAAQLNHVEPRTNYQSYATGTGGAWGVGNAVFTTTAGWRGDSGVNNSTNARGWVASFDIPFSSLGVSATPSTNTIWGMGVSVHDRDEGGGDAIPSQNWPQTLNPQRPASWGQLAFGIPAYAPPSSTPGGFVKIRQGLQSAIVADAHVGGHTTCAQSLWPNFFGGWGSLNYSGVEQVNIQNQNDVADWPCFSKYYITFPLDSLPAGKAIISATMTLHQFGNSGQGSTPGPQVSFIQALTVADPWNENTINWNNAPRALENIATTMVNPVSSNPIPPGVPVRWDISRAVATAYATGTPLRLVLYSADSAYHSGKYFWSSDIPDFSAEGRPTLDISWGEPSSSPPPSEIDGDVNCDATRNAVDALFILQFDVGMRRSSSQCPLPSETLYTPTCDVNEDAACTIIDALFVVQCSVGITNAACPLGDEIVAGEEESSEAKSASVIVHSREAEAGKDVAVSITADSTEGLLGATSISIKYDPSLLEPVACIPDPAGIFDYSSCNMAFEGDQTAPDIVRFNLLSVNGREGDFALANIVFHVKAQANITTAIDVDPSGWTNQGEPVSLTAQGAEIRISAPTGASPIDAIFIPLVAR